MKTSIVRLVWGTELHQWAFPTRTSSGDSLAPTAEGVDLRSQQPVARTALRAAAESFARSIGFESDAGVSRLTKQNVISRCPTSRSNGPRARDARPPAAERSVIRIKAKKGAIR